MTVTQVSDLISLTIEQHGQPATVNQSHDDFIYTNSSSIKPTGFGNTAVLDPQGS